MKKSLFLIALVLTTPTLAGENKSGLEQAIDAPASAQTVGFNTGLMAISAGLSFASSEQIAISMVREYENRLEKVMGQLPSGFNSEFDSLLVKELRAVEHVRKSDRTFSSFKIMEHLDNIQSETSIRTMKLMHKYKAKPHLIDELLNLHKDLFRVREWRVGFKAKSLFAGPKVIHFAAKSLATISFLNLLGQFLSMAPQALGMDVTPRALPVLGLVAMPYLALRRDDGPRSAQPVSASKEEDAEAASPGPKATGK